MNLRMSRAEWARLWQLRLYACLLKTDPEEDTCRALAAGLGNLRVRRVEPTAAALRRKVGELLSRRRASPPPPLIDEPVFAELARLFGCSHDDVQVLAFACALQEHPDLREAVDLGRKRWHSHRAGLMRLLASALELPGRRLRDTLRPRGPLQSSGLLRIYYGQYADAAECLEPADHMLQLLDDGALDARFLDRLFERASATALSLEDYPHLAAPLQRMRDYLAAAARDGAGANILLHGLPGTGKSELARALAASLGMDLFLVRTANADGEPIEHQARLQAYDTAQRALSANPRALLLFDEIEDVFRPPSSREERAPAFKSWINRRLETTTVPCLWVGNRIGNLDDSQLRRFDMVLEVTAPPFAHRRTLLRRALGDRPIDDALLDAIADHASFTPAHYTRAARVLDRLGIRDDAASAQILRGSLDELAEVQGVRRIDTLAHPLPFDPAWINTTPAVDTVARALAHDPRGRLCLYGPPGTGKTALAAHLARELGRPLLLRRASDLLSAWVGETEARISAMFRQAEREGAVLCLDEADSFLRDRQQARSSWEVTQVNELLTQLEDFRGLFVASTNLIDQVDAAALRRFDFKLRFDWLRPAQAAQLFLHYAEVFALAPDVAPDSLMSRLASMGRLAPGDFAAQRRRLAALRGQGRHSDLLEALAQEMALKPGGSTGGMGFTAALTAPRVQPN